MWFLIACVVDVPPAHVDVASEQTSDVQPYRNVYLGLDGTTCLATDLVVYAMDTLKERSLPGTSGLGIWTANTNDWFNVLSENRALVDSVREGTRGGTGASEIGLVQLDVDAAGWSLSLTRRDLGVMPRIDATTDGKTAHLDFYDPRNAEVVGLTMDRTPTSCTVYSPFADVTLVATRGELSTGKLLDHGRPFFDWELDTQGVGSITEWCPVDGQAMTEVTFTAYATGTVCTMTTACCLEESCGDTCADF